MRLSDSTTLFNFLAQCLFAGVVVTMGIFVGVPWFTLVAVMVIFVINASLVRQRRGVRWHIAAGWICTLVAWGGLLVGDGQILTLDTYYAVILLLIAVGIMLASWRLGAESIRTHWNLLGLTWAFLAGFLWIGVAYLMNLKYEFHAGLCILGLLLLAAKFLFRLPVWAVQIANTMLLLLVGLPVADVLVRPTYKLTSDAQAGEAYYSYEFARKNPAAFAHWWNHFVAEWRELQKDICTHDTRGLSPFLLRPSTEGLMFQSRVHINSLGFRGPEIAQKKDGEYRIVALGESTTFGHTINADDVTWPRVLEGMINERLMPDRTVQVINAGIPSYTIRLNVERLAKEILPLEPDMIISYHGYNGFMWLNSSLPPTHGKGPPAYEERPLKLLADSEYRLKMMAYRSERAAPADSSRRIPTDPMETEYAQAYGDLYRVARTNGIHLVLANYSMAVNAQSDPDVINFYRLAFPQVLSQIKANEIHSGIVAELATKHPEICFVNTHPGLDSEHDKFIDLVHFTQPGREQIAESMFQSIEPILKRDITGHEPALIQQ